MAYKAMDIAKKLISRARDDEEFGGAGLTNLKLQKLLYYEQGYHLAFYGTPLFDEAIEAWMYGPVVPEVYNEFVSFGSSPIAVADEPVLLEEQDETLFNNVYDAYRDFSAIGLMNKTHAEPPWLEARPHNRGTVITLDSLRKYFLTQIS